MIYNKDRTILGTISSGDNDKNVYQELVMAIKHEGWNGEKAFFNAYLSESGDKKKSLRKIMINTVRVIPVETW